MVKRRVATAPPAQAWTPPININRIRLYPIPNSERWYGYMYLLGKQFTLRGGKVMSRHGNPYINLLIDLPHKGLQDAPL